MKDKGLETNKKAEAYYAELEQQRKETATLYNLMKRKNIAIAYLLGFGGGLLTMAIMVLVAYFFSIW